MGMWLTNWLACRSAHWPKMLAANTPVSNSPPNIRMTPRPGMWRKASSVARAPSGSTACEADTMLPNTPSSKPSTECKTQIVMASGSQTSRPAIRYFFTRIPRKETGSLPAGGWFGAGRCGGRRWFFSAGSRYRSRRSRGVGVAGLGLAGAAVARSGISGAGRRGCGTAAKIGHVPARAFELKAGGRDLLLEGRGPARGADVQHGIGDLLQHILRVAAGRASVGIDRHD